MNTIEKIKTVLRSSPYAKGDNIEGRFIISPDNSIEFTIGFEMNSASYMFTEDGDLLLTVTPRDE